ncbi:MAG: TldD/PmbA family protein [Thermoplasmata archaeon]|nr:TldD/PmbA family protein [Thermoplasmata archaeon]
MEELVRAGLAAAEKAGALYADVRVIAPQRYEHLAVRNGEATALTYSSRSGLGVRVRTRGSWGFATASGVEAATVRDAARLAVRVARAAEGPKAPALPVTSEPGPSNGRYQSRMKLDPFEIPREEKLALLTDAERALHVAAEVKNGHTSFQAWEEVKWFGSSEGVHYRSRIVHVGAGADATAISGGDVQRRSFPNSFGGDYGQAGFEFVRSLDLVGNAEKTGREAVALLNAPPCPASTTTIVLASDQLALQVHESVGHAVELDRILAWEAGFAGTSWVAADDIGKLTYGSPAMNIRADASEPGGLGTFGWDDEGTPARSTPIVKSGKLVGVLSSKETASRVGLSESGGTARAEGFHRAPLVRMTNVNLEAGDASMDELLEGVADGIFFSTNRSWSIDDKRLNFQFGCEVGRRILKGELGPMVRNPIYSGMTPEFWRSMDLVGDESTWHLWGLPNCGKGQPVQSAHVGHGAPVARFRNVSVRGG